MHSPLTLGRGQWGQCCPHLVLLLVLQDGLQKGTPLMAGGLLVKHASLDHLLIDVELVLGRSQNLLLHTIDCAEAEHAHLVLLPNAVGSVLRLQVLGKKHWSVPSKHFRVSRGGRPCEAIGRVGPFDYFVPVSCLAILLVPTSSRLAGRFRYRMWSLCQEDFILSSYRSVTFYLVILEKYSRR